MFWLECISPIAKGDLKWRDALLVAHRVNSNQKSFNASPSSVEICNTNCHK